MSVNLVIRGEVAEASVELDGSRPFRMGRSRSCDLVLDDPTVSRHHAEIRMESERVVVRDLDSTNGTFVNDHRTVKEVITAGDRIRLGSAELVLSLDRAYLPRPDWMEQVAKPDGEILFGVAENLSPVDLVQVLAAHGKTGTLMLYNGRFGRIDFRDGRVCFAKVDGIEGEKAFHRIVGWRGAEFQFRNGHPKQVNLELPTERLLVDNVKYQEEMQILQRALPDPRAELSLKTPSSSVELAPLEEEVVREVSRVRTLAGLMDASSSTDIEIARAVARLIELSILSSNPTESRHT